MHFNFVTHGPERENIYFTNILLNQVIKIRKYIIYKILNRIHLNIRVYYTVIYHEIIVFYNWFFILQHLKTLYDTERNKISQKTTSFISAVMQVSNDGTSDVKLLSNVITKNSWLKLSNENLVYGFTLQNTSKL